MEIYIVIVSLVFGGVNYAETFTNKEEANDYILEWANDHTLDGISFETSEEALEWFLQNNDKVDYIIELKTSSISLPKQKTDELSFSFGDYDYEETRDLWDGICSQLNVDADNTSHIVVEYVKVHAEKDEL